MKGIQRDAAVLSLKALLSLVSIKLIERTSSMVRSVSGSLSQSRGITCHDAGWGRSRGSELDASPSTNPFAPQNKPTDTNACQISADAAQSISSGPEACRCVDSRQSSSFLVFYDLRRLL